MAFKVRMRKNINIGKVVALIVGAVISLYVGGQLLSSVATVMINTSSPFYNGFTLIGWTVEATTNASGVRDCATDSIAGGTGSSFASCITSTDTSGGLLTVVGLIAVAAIVMQFVKFKL